MQEWLNQTVSDNIGQQLWLLVVSFIAGIGIAVVYDVFRGLRRFQRLRCKGTKPVKCEVRVHLEDVLFWCIYVVITYYIFYRYHNGAPAGYVFLGEIAAIWLYYHIFKNWGRCACTCIIWQICTIFGWVFKVFSLPFRIICGKFIKTLKYIVKSVKMVIINN